MAKKKPFGKFTQREKDIFFFGLETGVEWERHRSRRKSGKVM